jgi:nucleotide-binding universal stress UspA family protein
MKTIVVAIDFSKWSKFALKYAIRIANQVDADVLMVWVDKAASMKPFYNDIKSNYLVEVKSQFEQLVNKNKKKLLKGKLEYKIRRGKVHTEVINQAKYSDAYLIVAGTHGASGFEEFWIGSNAYRIVASSICPVITIRNGFCVLESTSKILLPIDSTIETRQKVPFTVNLAKSFDAEIMVLALYSSNVDEIRNTVDNYTSQTVSYIKKQNVKYSLNSVKVENNVADTVIDYVKKEGIDLVSILTEQESSISNIILGPYAQQIVNHCPVPVITMHATDIFDIATR